MLNAQNEPKVTSHLFKTGRNDPCPCGSGKKYKKCCLIHTPASPLKFQENKSSSFLHHLEPEKETNTVLLSICIPSYNRGKRAYENILHNLSSSTNGEIEIVLSNNGTQNESKEYYSKIKRIKDERLKYFAFDQNKGVAINFCKVAEIATGKFVLLLSDEDLIDFSQLEMILNILRKDQDTIAVVKIGSNSLPSIKLAHKGEEALLTYMLTSNYMSGLIFNRTLLKNSEVLEYIKSNLNNHACAIYPHMIWELFLSQYGCVVGIDNALIKTGKAESSDLGNVEVGDEQTISMVKYATLDSRLEQHQGFLEVFKDLEICNNNFDVMRKMYVKLCLKTMFLVSLSINNYFKKTDLPINDLLIKAYMFCVKGLYDIYCLKASNPSYFPEDLNSLGKIYNHHLSSFLTQQTANS